MVKEKEYEPRQVAEDILKISFEHFRKQKHYMKLAEKKQGIGPTGNRYKFTQSAVDKIKAMRAYRPQVVDDE